MEPTIQAYLDRYYPGLPAFLFGSRVNNYPNGESDWDVGIIGAKKKIEFNGIQFVPIDSNNLDRKAVMNVFHKDIFPFVRKVTPLRGEAVVRNVERKAKEHAIQYTIQESGKNSVSGEDVVTFYSKMNAQRNPEFREKCSRFLRSGDAVKTASEDYEEILSGFKPSHQFPYRDYRCIDFIRIIENKIRDLREASNPTPSKIFNYIKNCFVKSAALIFSDYLNRS